MMLDVTTKGFYLTLKSRKSEPITQAVTCVFLPGDVIASEVWQECATPKYATLA